MNVTEKKGFLRLEKGRVESYDEYDAIPLCAYITVIGRSPGRSDTDLKHPDIEIRDDFVSRSHLSITYIESEDAYIMQERDGGTRNGTFLNEERIQPSKTYPLKNGDLIGLALVVTEVVDSDNVGVVSKASHCLGLTLDAGAVLTVELFGLYQGEGDVTVEGIIVGEVYFLLAALTEEFLYYVAAAGKGGGFGYVWRFGNRRGCWFGQRVATFTAVALSRFINCVTGWT